MRDFVVQGVQLRLPDRLLTPSILKAFETGRYERLEANQLPRFLRDGDRLLELGGGVGFISTIARRAAKLESCTVIEANPDLIEIIRETHRRNAVAAEVHNAVVLSKRDRTNFEVDADDTVAFFQRKNFWGSSLLSTPGYASIARIPVVDFDAMLGRVRPSIIIADIEGGEANLFDGTQLHGVRHILIELHKNVIGLRGITHIGATLAAQGLHYDPDYSIGAVVMFSREWS